MSKDKEYWEQQLKSHLSAMAGSMKLPDGLTELGIVDFQPVEDSLYVFTKERIYRLINFPDNPSLIRVW